MVNSRAVAAVVLIGALATIEPVLAICGARCTSVERAPDAHTAAQEHGGSRCHEDATAPAETPPTPMEPCSHDHAAGGPTLGPVTAGPAPLSKAAAPVPHPVSVTAERSSALVAAVIVPSDARGVRPPLTPLRI